MSLVLFTRVQITTTNTSLTDLGPSSPHSSPCRSRPVNLFSLPTSKAAHSATQKLFIQQPTPTPCQNSHHPATILHCCFPLQITENIENVVSLETPVDSLGITGKALYYHLNRVLEERDMYIEVGVTYLSLLFDQVTSAIEWSCMTTIPCHIFSKCCTESWLLSSLVTYWLLVFRLTH